MQYKYTVSIMGQDYDPEYGWADEARHIMEVPCDSYEDAIAFCDAITTEQVLEWERESDCNGLDAVIYSYEFDDNGVYTYSFIAIGEYEWIGPNRNDPPMIWSEA